MDILRDYKSMLLLALVIALILVSIFLSYNKYLVGRGFLVEVNIFCDLNSESCFKQECDSDDPRCPSDGVFYFKVIEKWAYSDVSPEECALANQCEVTHCENSNASTYSDYETCFSLP